MGACFWPKPRNPPKLSTAYATFPVSLSIIRRWIVPSFSPFVRRTGVPSTRSLAIKPWERACRASGCNASACAVCMVASMGRLTRAPKTRSRSAAFPTLEQSVSIMDPDPAHAADDLWIFAYGSLMWRPDFSFVQRLEARLIGAHRALCVYSFVHRGTPERPGLVLGLDRGGTCRGIAYRVSAAQRANTIVYLRKREQVTSVYRECTRPIWLKRDPEQRVPALCYMVDRGHVQ